MHTCFSRLFFDFYFHLQQFISGGKVGVADQMQSLTAAQAA